MHVLWAGVISLVLSWAYFLEPVDKILWILQHRTITTEASGDIVYIGSERDLADPGYPKRREELAGLIGRLDEAGVQAVYIDTVFSEPTRPETDNLLNAELRAFNGEVYLVESVGININREDEWQHTIPAIGHDVEVVGAELPKDYMGYVWDGFYNIPVDGRHRPSVPAQMVGLLDHSNEIYPINYGIALETIPTMTFAAASQQDSDLSSLTGKTVIIGNEADAAGIGYDIPGQLQVSSSIVHIMAAETLKAEKAVYVPRIYGLLLALLLLGLISQLRGERVRRVSYLVIAVAIPVTYVHFGYLGWRTSFAEIIALFGIYGVCRLRSRWKDSFALVDLETNLPSFAALEGDKDVAESLPAIIVAKIHRFEHVRRTLPKELHAEYLLAITGRLKAATQDATIYLGQGHMIAWTMPEKDPALLREHLAGLRALFSSPLLVGDNQVDVGISFGVDITPSPNVTRRLASAVAVAEQTNETFEPIVLADSTSDEDLIWNISLQARIDAALKNGEIYLAFQPKVMVQTGEIIGVEALVRWKDPVKGQIPPDNFIRQCETAGRMSHLTRFVLEEACKAGHAFEDAGLSLPVAVNISATLVHERPIVTMVSEVLERTGFEPRRLTLEVTETYRISNIDRAAEILAELKDLGIKISMDDFGVGAASLEALLRLPFSELKIDRTFTSQMTTSAKAEGIVRSILQMGKDLRIIVVAEGVEDAGTLTLLRESGCLVAQGFGISRPLSQQQVIEIYGGSESVSLKKMV